MGDNSKPTVRIGSRVIGEVKGKVTNKGKTKIEIDGESNFDVDDSVEGEVAENAHVFNEATVDQKVATATKTQPKELEVNDYQKEVMLRAIGDTTYIGSKPLVPEISRIFNNIGAVTIAETIKGKAKNSLMYNGDGHEYYDLILNSKEVRIDSNIGSVTVVGECAEISHLSDVSVAARNKDYKIPQSLRSDRRNSNIGHMTIFNQESFANQSHFRHGSVEDADALERTFSKFGISTTVRHSMKLKQIIQEIDFLSKADFNGLKLFMCVLMTHGTENGFVAAYDKSFNHKKIIINPILKNKSLNGIPKIFIIVACRGPNQYYEDYDSDYDDGFLLSTNDGVGYSDLLVCYSTYDGHKSKRRSFGTYYIQTLCQIFEEEDSIRTDIHSILARLNNILSKEHKIQVPIFESTMGVFCMNDLLLD